MGEGTVVEVIPSPAGDNFRVRREDGHETSLFPSSDATVEHAAH